MNQHIGFKLKLAVIGICLSLITLIATAQEKTPVQKTGKLKVKGGKILGASGQVARLRGVSMSWSIWGGKKYYNPQVVNWLQSDFKINLLRVSMAVQPDGGYLQNPDEQEALVVKTIDAAIAKGLYVLLDWHDHHADQHLAESKAFFAKMARRYTGKPNIIYEVFNEPEKIAWQTVKDYAIQVIAEIRKYDAHNLIIVGSPKWDQDVDVAAKDPITSYKNIAYSFHFYASDPNHQELLMKKADEAIAAGLPIMVTEWGVGEADGNGEFNIAKSNKWLDWMERHQLSWANWNITDKKETTAILQPGASVKGGWRLDTLSPAGQYIRTQLRKLNQ